MSTNEPNLTNCKIGQLIEKDGHKGIYIGKIGEKPILVDLYDASKTMTWDEAMDYAKKEGKRLPTQQELFLMFIHKKELNEGLKNAGGQLWDTSWYWSSSEFDDNSAWIVTASKGYVNSYYKGFKIYHVRCLLN